MKIHKRITSSKIKNGKIFVKEMATSAIPTAEKAVHALSIEGTVTKVRKVTVTDQI